MAVAFVLQLVNGTEWDCTSFDLWEIIPWCNLFVICEGGEKEEEYIYYIILINNTG